MTLDIVGKIAYALIWFCLGIIFKIIVDETIKKKEVTQLNKEK